MNGGSVRVWDPFIRVFRWSLAVLFATAWLTEEEGWLHEWAGYGVLALIAARIAWGVVGPRHARFTDFVRSPLAALGYLRGLLDGSARRALGHNPAGGWMAILLLATLLVTGGSGVIVLGLEGAGPLAGRIDAGNPLVTLVGGAAGEDEAHGAEDRAPAAYGEEEYGEEEEEEHDESVPPGLEGAEEAWEEIHELAANLALVLVILHVLGVLASSLAHRENLVRAMITGRKRAE